MAGTGLSRGKRALMKSILEQQPVKKQRLSQEENLRFWCESGLDQDGFEKKLIDKKIGFGVFTTQQFTKGSFLLEYVGERITPKEADEREKRKKNGHCYVYYFKWNGMRCIDASESYQRLGRYVNDAAVDDNKNNAVMKLKVLNNYPRLCLFARRDIEKGEEIRYDYGDSINNLPWRHQSLVMM